MWMSWLLIQHLFTSSFLRGSQFCSSSLSPGLTWGLSESAAHGKHPTPTLPRLLLIRNTQVIPYEPKTKAYSLGWERSPLLHPPASCSPGSL